MIVAGTYQPIHIDLGKNEPGMTLQRRERDGWVDVIADGEAVISPVDIDELPPG